MINLHLYPSVFTHESRILRETRVLAANTAFSRFIMVGITRPDLPEREAIDEKREIRRIPRTARRGFVGKVLGTLAWARRVESAFASEPDIACINAHSLSVLPLAARLADQTGAKLIYDAHELETETHGVTGLRRVLSKRTERRLIGRADGMMVVSEGIADWYAKTYDMPRPEVVLNCPEHAAPPRGDLFREKLGIARDQRIYLYQGALGPGRGIEAICDAFESLPLPRPALVFMGDGALGEFIRARAAGNRDIRLTPAVSPKEVLHYTASADVGLCLNEHSCLSHYYCMPNKIFEYIRAGIPAICSDLPELKRVVDGERIGVIARDNTPAGIAAAVREMQSIDLEIFGPRLAEAAAKYSWNRQAEKLLKVYAALGFVKDAAG
jgi:glycosyltransferase involved in cell wall biosynthesis